MSGGHWDYKQYFLTEVIEDLSKLIHQNGQLKSYDELKEQSRWDRAYHEKYPEDKFHIEYSDEIIEHFEKGAEIITQAQIYIQRIDWLLSGDDGPETFIERLKEDLKQD
jgi:hypothetical protein